VCLIAAFSFEHFCMFQNTLNLINIFTFKKTENDHFADIDRLITEKNHFADIDRLITQKDHFR
jgi:hypothetical protein